ncbi:MAG: hypothetical protein A2W72_16180 [Burkholderiales bacterium RIFCSPLOWO2_12_67_14]|nr:MAG: hypothetical protein A3I64_01780 [Burkholderiales bacterium RIFCSPLOWO2_02_FULL_67_64]OGB38641.1 MAG: hypothetical protein A2W72_16180 [Burkholderiales bacterium RIFCSPLOWO2_12_67_14]OGB40314.1 MAG: hypothetical protein A3E51_26805 [Burkholderiales bacterium RIFCSPHIGHO2_12_FULL_67_38]OGB78808.1 MAG: hypothetical protein A3G82_09675 [Burkholderiales bacterium RIFCSPLOWO2_12_FULL_67_210]
MRNILIQKLTERRVRQLTDHDGQHSACMVLAILGGRVAGLPKLVRVTQMVKCLADFREHLRGENLGGGGHDGSVNKL